MLCFTSLNRQRTHTLNTNELQYIEKNNYDGIEEGQAVNQGNGKPKKRGRQQETERERDGVLIAAPKSLLWPSIKPYFFISFNVTTSSTHRLPSNVRISIGNRFACSATIIRTSSFDACLRACMRVCVMSRLNHYGSSQYSKKRKKETTNNTIQIIDCVFFLYDIKIHTHSHTHILLFKKITNELNVELPSDIIIIGNSNFNFSFFVHSFQFSVFFFFDLIYSKWTQSPLLLLLLL